MTAFRQLMRLDFRPNCYSKPLRHLSSHRFRFALAGLPASRLGRARWALGLMCFVQLKIECMICCAEFATTVTRGNSADLPLFATTGAR